MHHCSTICSYEYWKSRHKKNWENLIYFKTIFVSRCFKIYKICSNFCGAASSVTIRMPRHYPQDIQYSNPVGPVAGRNAEKKRKTNGNYKQFRSLPHNIKPPQKPRFWQEFTQTNGTIQWGCSILQRWDYVKHVFEVSILAPIILTTKNGGQNTWTSSENTWIR